MIFIRYDKKRENMYFSIAERLEYFALQTYFH